MECTSNFAEDTAAFLRWFEFIPGSSFHKDIEIRDLRAQNAGRGIVAKADIESETVLFSIPRTFVIKPANSELVGLAPSIFEDAVPAVDGEDGETEAQYHDAWTSLILILIYEYIRGEDSRWKPYLDVLPSEFNTLMFWSDEELAHLQASSVIPRIGKAEADEMIRTKILATINHHKSVFFPGETRPLGEDELFRLAHRMGSIIMAYAFNLEKDDDDDDEADEQDGWVEDREGRVTMGMVPMADILNADAQFNAHINHDDENRLTATALRPIKAGEEILNYYGPLSNGELLRRYGYTTQTHQRYDVVELSWDLVLAALTKELALSSAEVEQITKSMDADEMEDSFVLDRNLDEADSTGRVSDDTAFRGLPAELEEQAKGFLRIARKSKPDAIPDSHRRDEIYLAAVRAAIEARLAEYPTSVAQDRALLGTSSGRQRMAVEVRLGEKMLLHEARDFVTGCLDAVDAEVPDAKRRRR